MVPGTYLRTPEIIEKQRHSYSKNKHIPWNKGKKLSAEYRRKISEGTKKGMTLEIKYKIHLARAGKSLSKSHREAIGRGVKGKQAGDKHYNWKGGKSSWLWIDKIYRSVEYRDWRKAIFERDNFTCVFCKKRGKRIQADHILPKCLYPELMFSLSNGRTLCEDCHKQTSTYGLNKKYMKLIINPKMICQPL